LSVVRKRKQKDISDTRLSLNSSINPHFSLPHEFLVKTGNSSFSNITIQSEKEQLKVWNVDRNDITID